VAGVLAVVGMFLISVIGIPTVTDVLAVAGILLLLQSLILLVYRVGVCTFLIQIIRQALQQKLNTY
jgi:hypothetical protein